MTNRLTIIFFLFLTYLFFLYRFLFIYLIFYLGGGGDGEAEVVGQNFSRRTVTSPGPPSVPPLVFTRKRTVYFSFKLRTFFLLYFFFNFFFSLHTSSQFLLIFRGHRDVITDTRSSKRLFFVFNFFLLFFCFCLVFFYEIV